jgi:hypothetical protein
MEVELGGHIQFGTSWMNTRLTFSGVVQQPPIHSKLREPDTNYLKDSVVLFDLGGLWPNSERNIGSASTEVKAVA